MKTTLEDTIALAFTNAIEDSQSVAQATCDLICSAYDILEASSKHLKYVRLRFTDYELEYDDFDNTSDTQKVSFGEILSISSYYNSSDEAGLRYIFLQQLAFGLLQARHIFEVKMFCLCSVVSFIRFHNRYALIELIQMAHKYLDFEIKHDTSIEELLLCIRNKITTAWQADTQITDYQESIIGCSIILEILLLDSIRKTYKHLFN